MKNDDRLDRADGTTNIQCSNSKTKHKKKKKLRKIYIFIFAFEGKNNNQQNKHIIVKINKK